MKLYVGVGFRLEITPAAQTDKLDALWNPFDVWSQEADL